jgi:outer membrane biosynthesis protein TonB
MEVMRRALLVLVLAAFSWPALAQQDQSQNPPATNPPPPSQAEPSTPTGVQPAPATAPPPSSAKKEKTHKKKSVRKKHRKDHKKPVPKKPSASDADAGPKRIVIRRGGTSDSGGQLEPGAPASDAAHQRHTTEQLLQATDDNLKSIAGRKLAPDQQDMVRQITLYMEQSRSADKEGDLGRARNLAMKAHMLSDALVRQ